MDTNSVALGIFNLNGSIAGSPRVFMVGNGASAFTRSNIFSVTSNGNTYTSNIYVNGSADFAEYFESDDGKRIVPGTSVVLLSNGKVRKASDDEDGDLMGVVSTTAAIIENCA